MTTTAPETDAPAIRFDPETGTLVGTTLPPAAELMRRAREAGFQPRGVTTWDRDRLCGCALGLAAALASPAYRARDYGLGSPIARHAIGDARTILGLPTGVALGVTYGFDAPDDDSGAWLSDPEERAAFAYGRACRQAAFGR